MMLFYEDTTRVVNAVQSFLQLYNCAFLHHEMLWNALTPSSAS
jgi:hypothetical protein